MSDQSIQKKHSTRRRDFIPNFEVRSVLILAAFAVNAAAGHAQTAAVSTSTLSTNSSRSQTAAARSGDRSGDSIAPNRVTGSDLDAAFNRADANRDGRLNREETEHFPFLAQRFELIDENRDTFISREEFNKAAGN